MRGVIGAAVGSVVAAIVIITLANWHKINVLPEDVQAAFSALIAGALSFLGGWLEHRRAERDAAKKSP